MNTTEPKYLRALVKMLPETIAMRDRYVNPHSLCRINTPDKTTLCWIATGISIASPVLETELLHLCWLVEEKLTIDQWREYANELYVQQMKEPYDITRCTLHLTPAQRITALAEVLEIKI